MKELLLNNVDAVAYIITFVVTYVLGLLAKKSKKISNNLIPIQDLLVGIICGIIYYAITGDINVIVSGSSIIAAYVHDAKHGLEKLLGGE